MIMKALSVVIALQLILFALGSEWELQESDNLAEKESFGGVENTDDQSLIHIYETLKVKPFYSLALDIIRNLRYRLDLVPCTTRMPEENQGLIYYTKVYYSSCRRSYKCFKRLRLSRGYDYSDNTIVIRPQTTGQGLYKKRALERHHIASCPSGHFCEFRITEMDLQPAAMMNGKTICLDYLEIVEENTNNRFEFCGNETRGNTRFTHNLQITFRSGFTNEGKGFKILITKTQKVVTNMEEGCLQESRDVSVEDYLKYFSTRSNERDDSKDKSRNDQENQWDEMEKKFEAGIDKNNNEGDVRFMESYKEDELKPNFDRDDYDYEEMRLMEELDGQRHDSREDGDLGDYENNEREEEMRRKYEGETRAMEERFKDYSRRKQNSQDEYERNGGFIDPDNENNKREEEMRREYEGETRAMEERFKDYSRRKQNSQDEYERNGGFIDIDNENNQRDRGYSDDDYERQRNKREGRFIEDDASNPNNKDDMERKNLIPYGTKQRLHQYYLDNQMKKVFGSTTTGDDRILRLATTSLRSCDKTEAAIADRVLSLFSRKN